MNIVINKDPFEELDAPVYMDSDTNNDKFPYNMQAVHKYLKRTGKTLSDITFNEIKQFLV